MLATFTIAPPGFMVRNACFVKCTAPKIDIEDLLPVLRREFLKGLEGHQPSIVDDHIKPGKAVHRRFHSACDLHVRGHIACHSECIRRAGFTQASSAPLRRVALQIGDDDARALGPKTPGGGEADPACRARDDSYLVAKPHSTTSNQHAPGERCG